MCECPEQQELRRVCGDAMTPVSGETHPALHALPSRAHYAHGARAQTLRMDLVCCASWNSHSVEGRCSGVLFVAKCSTVVSSMVMFIRVGCRTALLWTQGSAKRWRARGVQPCECGRQSSRSAVLCLEARGCGLHASLARQTSPMVRWRRASHLFPLDMTGCPTF